MRGLILNADDLGYTPGINRAVEELHGAGLLSSATLMARGLAFHDALLRLRNGGQEPPLGIGCHVVLVDGTPCSGAEQIPSLLGNAPRSSDSGAGPGFRPTLGSFARDLLRGRIREDEIEAEAVAQIRTLQAAGLRVTHIDTHKHTHMFGRVLRPLLRAALQCGVAAVRNPFEPPWSRRATHGAPAVRRMEVRLLSSLRGGFLRLVAEAGLRTTAGALGVLSTGSLDTRALEALLTAAMRYGDRDAVYELVCHPGYQDQALAAQATRLQGQRERERQALHSCSATLRQLPLIHFGHL